MSARFPKQSTRPLTAESYQRLASKARHLAENVTQAAHRACAEGATAHDKQRLTRAIRDLCMHAKRLDDRHRGITGDDNA